MWSRAEILQEYAGYYAALLEVNPEKSAFVEQRYAPDKMHRWSVVLECGCVTQALTPGEDYTPADGPWHRLFPALFSGPVSSASDHVFVIGASADRQDVKPGFILCSEHRTYPFDWHRRIVSHEYIGRLA
jgi:hypothetical protein